MRVAKAPVLGPRGMLGLAACAAAAWPLANAPLNWHTTFLLLFAPVLEELVFRAGLHETLLRRLRLPLLANALTALVFALAHVMVRGDGAAFAVMLPALLIGIVYQRWRKVWPCVLLHGLMNAIWLAI